MTVQIEGKYSDGKSSRIEGALLLLTDDGGIRVQTSRDSTICINANFNVVELSSRLGNVPRIIKFRDGSQFVTSDNDGIDAYLAGHRLGIPSLHLLESHLGLVAVATIFTIVFIALFVWKGVPNISQAIAMQLPEEIVAQAGEGSLEVLDKFWLEPSKLSEQKKIDLNGLFSPYLIDSDVSEIAFRRGIGPNALALPDGMVVFTDELVLLAENDNELIAILFHEIGHLQRRHFLRRIIQDSLATVVLAMVFGDIEIASMVLGVPALFLDAAYSRQFELEADRYALNAMNIHDIELKYFGSIMERLQSKQAACRKGEYCEDADDFQQQDEGGNTLWNYLSTHPVMDDRILLIEEYR